MSPPTLPFHLSGLMFMDPLEPPPSVPGLRVRRRLDGFTATLTATAQTLSALRGRTVAELMLHGVGKDAAETAELLVSELIGNAAEACAEAGVTPELLVEAFVSGGITVAVHDPVPHLMPHCGAQPMDDDVAESGRGLLLLDVLAPGWAVEPSRVGKQVRCHIPK